jgi:hypothetical protein
VVGWFSPGTSISSTNNTDRQDITEILLNVAHIFDYTSACGLTQTSIGKSFFFNFLSETTQLKANMAEKFLKLSMKKY